MTESEIRNTLNMNPQAEAVRIIADAFAGRKPDAPEPGGTPGRLEGVEVRVANLEGRNEEADLERAKWRGSVARQFAELQSVGDVAWKDIAALRIALAKATDPRWKPGIRARVWARLLRAVTP